MNLDGFALPVKKLKGTDPVEMLDLSGKNLGVASAVVIASLISVNGTLTSVKLRLNKLGEEGWGAIFAAICGNKDSKIMSIDAYFENIGPAGVELIAAALRTSVTGALTRVDVRLNNIVGDGAVQLSAAVLGNLKIEMFNEIPIKEMRADSLTELDLKEKHFGVEGGMVVAGLIPVMGALTVANLLGNQLDAESAKMLAEVAKQKGVSLCGIQRDQTTADLSGLALQPPDAILLASDLSQAVVTGGLTSLDLSNNLLCGVTTFGGGTYTAEGITAIAEALRVNDGLTKISLANNELGEEGTKAICEALEQNKMLKELDISNIGGTAGVKHVAKMLGVNGGLTSINLSDNQLCGVWTDYAGQHGAYTAEGITAIADALRVNGGLTALDVSNNCLEDEGVSAVCEAIQSNKETKLASLNFRNNDIGPVGANAVAAMVAVTGALTSLNLSSNNLCSVTETGYIKASQVLGSSFNEGDKVVYLGKEMIVSKSIDRDGDIKMTHLPLMSGLNALANALRVNGALTMCDLRDNYVGEEGKALICNAAEGKAGFKLHL